MAIPAAAADSGGGEVHDVVVIGSGPAGYTAAFYTARAGLAPLVIEGAAYGGALMTTTEVENFPGFPDPVLGPDLMVRMRTQAARFGAQLRSEDATEVDLTGPIKTVTAGGVLHRARAVILATGARHRTLGVPGEARLLGHGVSACATCDGFFFRGRDIAVIGGGDSALQEAMFLTRFAASVTVIHRRAALRASQIMQQRARADPKIRFVWDTVVDEVLGRDTVTGLVQRHLPTGARSTLAVAGVFIAIGHQPNRALLAGQVELGQGGYVHVAHPSTRTSQPGVFAFGDLVDHEYRQAITAAGTGAAAALDAQRFLAATAADHTAHRALARR